MDPFFNDIKYDTPKDTRCSLGYKIFLKSRFWFYYLFAKIVFKSRFYIKKGIYDNKKWAEASFDILKAIERCGGRFHIRGLDNLKKSDDGPIVFISNHMSTLETVVLPCLITLTYPATFIVKKKLVKGPIFGPIMRSRDPIVVGRKNPRKDLITVLKRGKEILSQRRSIIVFPQSTRQIEFIPERFNTLGIKLAKNSGVKILPIALKTDFWGNGKLIRGFGKLNPKKTIYFEFGKPMDIQGNGRDEHKKIIEFIQFNLNKWEKK